ncbi:cupin domain-containing protein [Kushneria phosphatilytica]|uniref:Cupin domain-containing protein n=1 Tax=Kushneria phosphatilytica TaxID=657387 RepID=A0A1S1NYE2_9GAMM|nr:cupin domain-containing protein [Kushneria phosphatilytica]OHV13895.1 hypothetical protein BH688_00675 [Kushneria phosphatilytica]QEL10455.1 cupin domain-containing protein [Kushneria phosphatilytica]
METITPNQVSKVEAGRDRYGRDDLMIWGVLPLAIKVSGQETNGQFMLFEHAGMDKGGPPRHVHYGQDEWFYIIRGVYVFEVGDARCQLGAGASLFAPREVPHGWACVSDEPGTLLTLITPVNTFEDFILETTRHASLPTREDIEHAFATHGMKLTGPPLELEAA